MINYVPNQSAGWKSALKELQNLRGKFKAHENIMTQYERTTIMAELDHRTESVAGMILTGALGEYNGAVAGYQAAARNVDKAKAAELRRWNARQLRDELANARTLAELAVEGGSNPLTGTTPAAGLQAIYAEAKQSGDMYKIRAAAEVLKVIAPKLTDLSGRAAVASMATDAGRDLDALRQTPEMATAAQEHAAALDKMMTLRDGLQDVGAAIGEKPGDIWDPSSLGKAMRKVRLNADHTAAEILSDTDPEVTGIDLSKLNAGG